MAAPKTLSDLKLTRVEAASDLWRRLELHLQGELSKLRKDNDSVLLNIAETTAKRGEIRFVKRMLALTEEAGLASRSSDEPDDGFTELTTFPPHGG